MDDLISRQAAIDAIRAFYDEYIVYDNGKSIEDLISELPSAQRWIPVTERLPEPYSGEYFVTINDGSVYTDVLWFDSPGDGRYESCFYKTDDEGYGVVCDDVIAWMPLPKPWEGEEDEQDR